MGRTSDGATLEVEVARKLGLRLIFEEALHAVRLAA
jgi:hypothetical protein